MDIDNTILNVSDFNSKNFKTQRLSKELMKDVSAENLWPPSV